MSRVSIFQDHNSYKVKVADLKRKAESLLNKENCTRCNINIVLTNDHLLKKLNRKFRKKNKPTDVLSFNFDDNDLKGEIYISLDRAKINTKEYCTKFYEELWKLTAHGLLHILGYTHNGLNDSTEMSTKETVYLNL